MGLQLEGFLRAGEARAGGLRTVGRARLHRKVIRRNEHGVPVNSSRTRNGSGVCRVTAVILSEAKDLPVILSEAKDLKMR